MGRFLWVLAGRCTNLRETDQCRAHARSSRLYLRLPTSDVAWNKPFKERLRTEWINFLLAQVREAGAGTSFKMTPPQRLDILCWIRRSWAPLSESTIVNGFAKPKLLIDPVISASVSPTPASAEPQTDWESLIRLLRRSSVPFHTIRPEDDIEQLAFADADLIDNTE